MNEKRFKLKYINEQHISANIYDNNTFIASIGIGDELIVELLNNLSEENDELKKDCTTLVYSNQEYRQENENLKKQLDYIQNSINEHIKHQKTELGQKALRKIIEDYNEWMLGHKELKE